MNDGGPAFPSGRSYFSPDGHLSSTDWVTGMTLRDYFLAHAPPVPDWWPAAKYPLWSMWNPPFLNDAAKMEMWHGWNDWLDEREIAPDLLAELKAAKESQKEHDAKRERECVDAEFQRLVDWRIAYVDTMLAVREAK